MDLQKWRERLTRWFAFNDLDDPKRPASTASDDVIDEYFERVGQHAATNLRHLDLEDQLRAIDVQQAMLWEAVPPEEQERLRQRILQMHRDHYRMTPEQFIVKYREYLDEDGALKGQG